MKKISVFSLSAVALFIIAAAIFGLLDTYTHTDKEQLFLTPTFTDNNGWEFYTIENAQHKELSANEVIETTGTFYLTKTLTQDLENSNYTFLLLDGYRPHAVFLDGELIYTNCPNKDLQFDNVEFDDNYSASSSRGEEVRCTLPNDFAGKKITIATAHGEYPALPAVKLSSNAIEEKYTITGTNKEMIPATGFAVMTLLLLSVWLFALLHGIRTPQYLLLIAVALLQMLYHLRTYEFISSASTALDSPFTIFIPVFAVLLPLMWLLLQMHEKRNKIIFGIVLGISAVVALIVPVGAVFGGLPFYNSFLANNEILYLPIAALFVFSVLEAKNKNTVFRLLLSGLGMVALCTTALYAVSMLKNKYYAEKIALIFKLLAEHDASMFLDWCIVILFVLTAFIGLYKIVARIVQIRSDLAVQTELAHLLDSSLKTQKQFYEAKLSSENEIRSLRHDMNGHLKTLQALLDSNKTEEAKNYLQGVSKQHNEQSVKIFSSNPYINAVLSNYDVICSKNNIRFECHIGVENYELPTTELCLILNNALENAVEASLTLPEKNREIKTQIAVRHNRFLLRVSNRFNGDIETDNGLPVTKKGSKEHGYGLSNIRAAAERKGGSMKYRTENGYFVLDVEFEIE